MVRFWTRPIRQVAGAVLALAVTAAALAAQSAVYAGRVTSAGQPIGGASVSLVELNAGAFTDADGRYTFTVNIAGQAGRTVTLRARAIGYSPKQEQATLAAGRIERDFDLGRDVLNLDQVVVTGVGDAMSTRKTPFSVGVVDASQIKEAPSSSPAGALAGRVAGATVVTVTGQPGAAPAIRLRSSTSLTGNVDPLIIIDGTISRLSLADINSEDIERMEVIKGAAASSLYGSDAANGVVQIFTKRGASLAEDQTAFTFRNEYGQSWLPNKVPGNMAHEFELLPDGEFALNPNGQRVQKANLIADNPYPRYYDQLNQVFRPGVFMTNYGSLGQRRGNTNYNASFHNSQESGVLGLLTGFSRQNFRINLDQAVGDKLTLQTGAFYGRSTSDEGENVGIFFGLRFLEPDVNLKALNPDGSPYIAGINRPPLSGNVVNPLYGLGNRALTRDRDRFNGTFKATYRALDWLTADANINYEQSQDNYKSLTPRGFLSSAGTKSPGSLFQAATTERAGNIGASLTAIRGTSWFTNTTKLAMVLEEQSTVGVSVVATALTVPRVPEFGAADLGADIRPGSFSETIRNQNFSAVTTFDIQDKYIVDAAVRQDESSLFGADNRRAIYSRVSGAWRVTEDFTIPGVDEFKLRASMGTAGLRPVFEAQYETFALVGGSPVGLTLGNRNLKPAFSKETEVGFNVNFLRDFTFEYSFSDRVTSDQILEAPVSSATGYQNQWINAGTLAGNTHELAFGAVLLSNADRFWRVNVTADRTRQRITALSVAPFLAGPDATTALFRVAAGEPFGVIYGSRWIRTPAQLDATIASNPTGYGPASNYRVNEEGYYVLTSAYGTPLERPLKAFDADGNAIVQIGDVNPDFTWAINQTFRWRGLSVNALLTGVQGGNIYNLTRQWPFNEQRDPAFDQRDKPLTERKPVSYYQVFYNNIDPNEYFVEDGSFVRLRELSINWQLPRSVVSRLPMVAFDNARLGIVGRNLWTSTNYKGYDPDVTGTSGLSGNPFTYRVDYFTYPQFRTFTMMLELGF